MVSADTFMSKHRGFFDFDSFNEVQLSVFDSAFNTDDNVIVAAPTGAGKTVIAELAMLREFSEEKVRDRGFRGKCLYLTPFRALSYEKEKDWVMRFGRKGFSVLVSTGEREITPREGEKADIIISTVEKWDSITRKWRQPRNRFATEVTLVIIDEVHLLDEDRRGATLEVLISRLKKIAEEQGRRLRVIALSATMPNFKEIAEWLEAKPNSTYFFDESFRPVKLYADVWYYKPADNPFYDKYRRLYKVLDLASRHLNEGESVLVFVSSRSDTVLAAKKVSEIWAEHGFPFITSKDREKLADLAQRVTNPRLKAVLPSGVAFHNAGLKINDRQLIEKAFREKTVKLLFSTSTLSWGVNLPAKCVIIRDVTFYDSIVGEKEISPIDLIQMLGRAGRPGETDEGYAWIIIDKEKAPTYRKLITEGKAIESRLLESLAEHINAEIQLGTIKALKDLETWIQDTFLFIRAKHNPELYGSINIKSEALKALNSLIEDQFVEKSEDGVFSSTPLGQLTSIFYMRLETAKLFHKNCIDGVLKSDDDLLCTVAMAKEFSDAVLRRGEKKYFKEFLEKVSSSLFEGLSSGNKKVLGIFLSLLSRQLWEGFRSDAYVLKNNGTRLLHALSSFIGEFMQDQKIELRARILSIRLKHEAPEALAFLLQVAGIGYKGATILASKGITQPNQLISQVSEKGLDWLLSLGLRRINAERVVSFAKKAALIEVEWVKVPEKLPEGENTNFEFKIKCLNGYPKLGITASLNDKTLIRQTMRLKKGDTYTLPFGISVPKGVYLITAKVDIFVQDAQFSYPITSQKVIEVQKPPKAPSKPIFKETQTKAPSNAEKTVFKTAEEVLKPPEEKPSEQSIIAVGATSYSVKDANINIKWPEALVIISPHQGGKIKIINLQTMEEISNEMNFSESEIEVSGSNVEGKLMTKAGEAILTIASETVMRAKPEYDEKITKTALIQALTPLKQEVIQFEEKKPSFFACKCGGHLIENKTQNAMLIQCDHCKAEYKLPRKASITNEKCNKCGLPKARLPYVYDLLICIDRSCESMDEIIKNKFESEGWKCTECGSPLIVIRRKGLVVGCSNYYKGCKTAYKFPDGVIIGKCERCGLPKFKLKTKTRCLNSKCV